MLDAGGLFVVPPGDRVVQRARALSPTSIAQIKSATRVSLIIAQQPGALEDVVVMFEGGGQVVLVKDRQPGVSARD